MSKKNEPPVLEKSLQIAADNFDKFDDDIKTMTMDRMNETPKKETEPQTKLSQDEVAKSKDIYLKPIRIVGPGVNPKTGEREKFNEKFRDEYTFAKEYVHFIAENNEIIGESIDLWTKPFPGCNAEEWLVPTNKPVWGPRYLAEQIKRKSYHRLMMQESGVNAPQTQSTSGYMPGSQFYGTMAVDTTIQRLDARPATSGRKSIFMGATTF